MGERFWVYILSNYRRSVLYIGITNNLQRRYAEHRSESIEGFTKRYHCHTLLYYEEYQNPQDAIAREKEMKGWRREKKEALIATLNPTYMDLGVDLL